MELSYSANTKIVTTDGEIKDIPYNWYNLLSKQLKDFRKDAAKVIELPAYCVFPDSTLINLLRVLPRNCNELWLVKGFSSTLIETYGKQICEIIDSFFKLRNVENILYGTTALELDSERVRGIIGYLGLTDYFLTEETK